MGIYETLGVRPVVNAAGPLTRLSGMPLHPEVAAAMAEAAQACVRIDELQEAAGRELVAATGAEAGYVTAGAAAGLALAASACVAGLDVAAMDRLPDMTGLRDEIVIQRAHLTAYSHALRLSGARLVEVGYVGDPGQGACWPWQVEAAISERTAALAYSVGYTQGVVPLAEVVEIAHRHGLPVIVDAAAALPPVENLRRFIADGADLVAFSGGKAIGGPQASGILVGRADLIESVALQHQDMDVYPETWPWRERYLTTGRLAGPPHHGLGRPMKVGKEEIAGLVVALRRFLARDHEAEQRGESERLATVAAALDELPGVAVALAADDNGTPRGYPLLRVRIDATVVGRSAAEVVNALAEGDPPVAVNQSNLRQGVIGVVATALRPGEEGIVAERLRAVLTGRA
ncbi:MAG TPA: aminotransferase class V-fold PLP-dependent enzyme [Thermomicrobiaceae bacterium]|nr:aminotransferase class V-fold PLP-dependent enzyme [Thermomicrobiaceae bacterium]